MQKKQFAIFGMSIRWYKRSNHDNNSSINLKNEIIKISFKYHDYTKVFNEINVNKLFKHRFHDHAIETKNNFFSILFIICLLRSLKLFDNIETIILKKNLSYSFYRL